MQLFEAQEDINSTRIMPRDPPSPPGTTNPIVAVGHAPHQGFAAINLLPKSKDQKIRNGDIPSSPPKRLTDSHGQSQANRKRSKRHSTLAAVGDSNTDHESRHGEPPEASQHTAWMFDQAERLHRGLSMDAIRNAIALRASAPPSSHPEHAFDGLRILGDQALLSAERFLQHPPLHFSATAGGGYLPYGQAMPSHMQVGFGNCQMNLASLNPLSAMSAAPYYPDVLGSLSDFRVARHESTVPISFLAGRVNHGVLLDDSHSINPAMHVPRPYTLEGLRAQSGFALGPLNMDTDVGLRRGTSHEGTTGVARPDLPVPHGHDPDPTLRGKPHRSSLHVPTPTSVENMHSPPSSSTTSYSGEIHPAQIVPGNAQMVASSARRTPVPLGIDEDVNWLSEFHCYVRYELVEVFQADRRDCKVRNFNVAHAQVGIRCRFCAHRPSRARALRSAAYPSSIGQIYQSFTMMLRDHFPNCDALPREARIKFMTFREIPAQGATDSKRYWSYAARKMGMVDSSTGIQIDESVLLSEQDMPPFGTPINDSLTEDNANDASLADERDRHIASEFLILLMRQARVVHLMPSERLGSRRNLPTNLVGFACRYCCEKRRLGQCRMFPSRRRTLPGKVSDLYDHLQRCYLCPASVKQDLMAKRDAYEVNPEGDDLFFDRVWRRLRHDS